MLALENKARQKTVALVVVVVAACATGSFLLLWSTPWGLGVTPDSVVYLDVARSLNAGNGLEVWGKPLTHFPPGYPFVLAVATSRGSDTFFQARVLHALLYAMVVTLVALLVYMATEGSFPAVVSGVLFYLVCLDTFRIHTMMWSETLFMVLLLGCFALLVHYLRHPRLPLLLAASFLGGLAPVTRDAGIVIVPTVILVVLLLSPGPFRSRLWRAVAAGAVSLLPAVAWNLRNAAMGESVASHAVVFHPVGLHHLADLLHTVYGFWIPVHEPPLLVAAQLLAAVALGTLAAVWTWRAQERCADGRAGSVAATGVCLLFCSIYLPFLIVTVSFIYANTPFDYRILFPLNVCLLVAVFALAWSAPVRGRWRWAPAAFLAFTLVSVSINAVRTAEQVSLLRTTGFGFASRGWVESPCVAHAKSVPSNVRLYSNAYDVLSFHTGRMVHKIAAKYDAATRQPTPNLDQYMGRLRDELSSGHAQLIYCTRCNWRDYLPTKLELRDQHHLPVLSGLPDGLIFGAEPSPAAHDATP